MVIIIGLKCYEWASWSFQGVMPLLGWLAGVSFAAQITAIDHWLAFVILGYLGVKWVSKVLRKPIMILVVIKIRRLDRLKC